MAPKAKIIPKVDYHIKLLAGNNVVLVEADNYDSEIFSPHIVNGRIAFLNIMPNRRCCSKFSKIDDTNNAKKETQETSKVLKEQNVIQRNKIRRISGGQIHEVSAPLANSAAECLDQRNNCCSYENNSTLHTPEPVRRAIHGRSPLLNRSMLNIPKEIKLLQTNHTPEKATAKEIGSKMEKFSPICSPLANSTPTQEKQRVIHGNMSFNSNSAAIPIQSSLSTEELLENELPARPKLLLTLPKGVRISRVYRNNTQEPNKLSVVTPCSSSIPLRMKNKKSATNTTFLTNTDSVIRWQKVLTPLRTYTKLSKKPVTARRQLQIDGAKKASKPSKYKPTYLVNPTQGPNVSQNIEIKKRKLIIDRQICISPKSFKKQLKGALDIRNAKSITQYPSVLSFHNPRRYVEAIEVGAFDLLTNSNRNRCLVEKLNQQFRKGCVNKASSTYSKYKVLSRVPPLKADEQVLEFSRLKSSQPSRHILTKK